MPRPSVGRPGRAVRRPIELLVVDVDGVLTDGVIAVDDRGVETKHFHVRDGLAYRLWQRAGKRSAILSGRRAAAVDRRAAELGIAPVIQGRGREGGAVPGLAGRARASTPGRSATWATTWPTCPCSGAVGLAACPADAAAEVRDAAHLVTAPAGGRGAVREVVEVILKRKGSGTAFAVPTSCRPCDQPRSRGLGPGTDDRERGTARERPA